MQSLLHSAVGLRAGFLMNESLQVSEPVDDTWMSVALEEASLAAGCGEVPVGAVVVRGQRLLAKAHNQRETTGNPTAHAEILAITDAARRVGSWRLEGCDLYVTLEPCAMCAGALVNARVRRLVFGASDPKGGFCGSLGDIVRDPRLNHRLEVVAGVQAEQCARHLRSFFARLRAR